MTYLLCISASLKRCTPHLVMTVMRMTITMMEIYQVVLMDVVLSCMMIQVSLWQVYHNFTYEQWKVISDLHTLCSFLPQWPQLHHLSHHLGSELWTILIHSPTALTFHITFGPVDMHLLNLILYALVSQWRRWSLIKLELEQEPILLFMANISPNVLTSLCKYLKAV